MCNLRIFLKQWEYFEHLYVMSTSANCVVLRLFEPQGNYLCLSSLQLIVCYSQNYNLDWV